MKTTSLIPCLLAIFALLLIAAIVTSCQTDDTDFSQYTFNGTGSDTDDDGDDASIVSNDTINIAWNGSSVTVTGDERGCVTTSGADVIVNDASTTVALTLVLSGSTSDGSLLVYRQLKYTMLLNGVDITNPDGPAINNQCSKSLYVICADGTENVLTDGASYTSQAYQQKGTFFSEGQIYFSGGGTLTANGNCMNAIASDDYITIQSGITLNAITSETGTNGIKANDGMFIEDGTLNIVVASEGGRGINCDARTVISGGDVSINTSGDCLIETVNGVRDTTSAAGIKSDSLFTMTGGELTITSTGDGGKGIRCNENVEISGGTLTIRTTGGNDYGKPKGIKSDTDIIISGGSMTVNVKKSWALDNGSDSETPADHITIQGTPTTASIAKKSVTISY